MTIESKEKMVDEKNSNGKEIFEVMNHCPYLTTLDNSLRFNQSRDYTTIFHFYWSMNRREWL